MRARKGCDWIVANDVSPETGIMGGSENQAILVTEQGADQWPRLSKGEVAAKLAERIADQILVTSYMVNIKVSWSDAVDRDLGLPTYETVGAAGADLRANLPDDLRDAGIETPGGRARSHRLRWKSRLGMRFLHKASGLALKHGAGQCDWDIDSDYRKIGCDPRNGVQIRSVTWTQIAKASRTCNEDLCKRH